MRAGQRVAAGAHAVVRMPKKIICHPTCLTGVRFYLFDGGAHPLYLMEVRTAADDGVCDVEGVRLAGHDGELVGAPARHAHHGRLKPVQVVAQAPAGRIGVVLVGACAAQALAVTALPLYSAAVLMMGIFSIGT